MYVIISVCPSYLNFNLCMYQGYAVIVVLIIIQSCLFWNVVNCLSIGGRIVIKAYSFWHVFDY